MWQDKQQYLDVIHRHLEIHGTIGKRKSRFGGSAKDVPSYVVNHGVLKFDDLQSLLKVKGRERKLGWGGLEEGDRKGSGDEGSKGGVFHHSRFCF